MRYKYKWNGTHEATFPGVGIVPAGAEFTTTKVLEGPGIEFISKAPDETDAPNQQAAATNAGKDINNG